MLLEKYKIKYPSQYLLFISLFWGSLAGVFSQGLNFVSNIILVRILGTNYGELVLYSSTNSMFQTFGLVGLNIMATVLVSKYLFRNKSKLAKLIPNMYYIVGILTLVVSVISLLINKLEINSFQFWKINSTLTLFFIIIWFVASTIDVLQISILAGFGAFKDLAKVSLIKGFLSVTLVSLFVYFWGVKGAIAGYAVSFSVSLFLNYIYLKRNTNLNNLIFDTSFDISIIKKLIIKSLPIFIAALVIVPAQWSINYIIFAKENGNLALSVFGIANQWLVLIQFFPLQISKVILPFLAKQSGNISTRTEKTGLYLSLFIAILLILISLLFEGSILRMYKFDFSQSVIPFRIMLLASLFSILNMYFGQIIIAKERSWLRTIADFIYAVSLFAIFVFVLRYSLMLALPLSYCFSYLIAFCSILILGRSRILRSKNL